jgi:hypothetical protein
MQNVKLDLISSPPLARRLGHDYKAPFLEAPCSRPRLFKGATISWSWRLLEVGAERGGCARGGYRRGGNRQGNKATFRVALLRLCGVS